MRTAYRKATPPKAYDEVSILAALPPDVRAAYLALDPRERRFLITANDADRAFYAQLPITARSAFACLDAKLRGEYQLLSVADREAAKAMSGAELGRFLNSGGSDRSAFQRAGAAEALAPAGQVGAPVDSAAPNSPAAVAAGTDTPAGLAGAIARELKEVLGGWAQNAPTAIERSCAQAYNLLLQGVDGATARTRALQTALSAPEVLPSLGRLLSARVDADVVRRGLLVMPELIAQVVTGGMPLDDILHNLTAALQVVVTARTRAPRALGAYVERTSMLSFPLRGGIAA